MSPYLATWQHFWSAPVWCARGFRPAIFLFGGILILRWMNIPQTFVFMIRVDQRFVKPKIYITATNEVAIVVNIVHVLLFAASSSNSVFVHLSQHSPHLWLSQTRWPSWQPCWEQIHCRTVDLLSTWVAEQLLTHYLCDTVLSHITCVTQSSLTHTTVTRDKWDDCVTAV